MVEELESLNQSLGVSRVLPLDRYLDVLIDDMPSIEKAPDMDFETIWSVAFALEDTIIEKKDIWLI